MKQQWNVGILLYDHVDLTDVAGPYEVFHIAAHTVDDAPKLLPARTTSDKHPFLIRTVSSNGQLLRANNGLRLQPDYAFEQAPEFDIVVIPGSSLIVLDQICTQEKEVIRWIARASTHCQLMTSVCTGAFLLAEAGLLDGKRATTHWSAFDQFEQRFPQIQLQRAGKFVDEGTIVTAGGVTSGFNMALHVVERLLGEDVAQLTARDIDFQVASRA
ncbi:DJ-1/PfpI family protein [Dictyobacter aurantiacus]|uniref:AraC family transcriptional regulator n=1 Tax=Dictyobacter aurantiacus TaxID=1936993 RepID=A0A401Z9F6_9CHLR|nr:DJ-1/PfpI family protein [Dictyobacter aurantiacus]GCE03443.1 AraC family transcriptional regulator [Dictyobacter aurantiacus]